MTEPPDYQDLTQRYMALWQDHMSNAASDPATAEAMARMMTGWQTLFGQMMQPPPTTAESGERNSDGTETGQAGPSSPAAASGSTDELVRDLNRRIAVLEDRVASLEAELQSIRPKSV